MPNHTITQLESMILARLAPLGKETGGFVNTLGAYGGEFGDAMKGKDQSLVVCPAILVRYLGCEYESVGGPTFNRVVRFVIYHVSANLESQEMRMLDLYEMLEKSKEILNLADLGTGLTPLTIEKETMVNTGESVAAYMAQYVTGFQEDTNLYQI